MEFQHVNIAANSAFMRWFIAKGFVPGARVEDTPNLRREVLETVQAAVDAVDPTWTVAIAEVDPTGHVTFKITSSVAATPA